MYSQDVCNAIAGTPHATRRALMSLKNMLLSSSPPRSIDLMNHAGAAQAPLVANPNRDYMSTRLKFIARCLRACNAWALRRDCRFHVALRISRLCRVALGDLFSASSRETEGWAELRAVAAEWTRRLRVEAGVAMGNVDACQFIQENRNICRDIIDFQPFRAASASRAESTRHVAALKIASPLHSNDIRAVTRCESAACVALERDFLLQDDC